MKIHIVRSIAFLAVFLTIGFNSMSAQNQAPAVLPPLISSYTGIWRHFSVPGLEVLSCASDEESKAFAEAFLRKDRELAEIFPYSLRMSNSLENSVPVTTILVNHQTGRDMSNAMDKIDGVVFDSRANEWDADGTTVLAKIADDGESLGKDATFSYFGVLVLVRRTPPLPLWFTWGEVMFQKEITWNDSGFNLPPMIWLAAVGQPNVPAKVLPMDKLFSDSVNDQVDLNVWRCQVELFLRWVFNGDSKCREGLWKFVDVSSRQPVTEALFKQCFGFGYTEMEKKLMDFIPRARGNYQGKRNVPITVVVNPIKLPSIVMRDATISEIARIKGSFDLRAIEFAKVNLRAKKLPSYIIDSCVDKYTDQAKVDLVGAYDQGVRDPAFLAVLGKYYAKVGDHAKARDFLGQAATAHVVLPSVYTELARICLSDALAKPTGSDGKLGSEQVKIIFDLLKESRNYGLSQFETLDIAKKVMNNSLVLSPDEKDFVEEEKMFFPQIPHIASFNRLTAEITQARSRIKTTN